MILSKERGKLISEKEYVFKKYLGRELTARRDDGIVRLRMYLIHQRYYMLTVSSPDASDIKQLESKEADRFLDSFQLIDDPKGAPAGVAPISSVESAFENLELPPDFHARPISWREVPSPEFGFTVWMPSEPFRKKLPLYPHDQRLDVQLWVARGEGATCQLLVQPFLSAPGDEATRGIYFKNFLNGVLEGARMKLESEKTISFEGHSGREYKMRGDVGIGVGRAFFIGSNLYFIDGRKWREYTLKRENMTGALRVFLNGRDAYALSAIRLFPDVDQKTISGFFDSFKLVEKSPKDEFAEPPPPPPR
jgi:hypothetical protein